MALSGNNRLIQSFLAHRSNMLYNGAEAVLVRGQWFGRRAVLKYRPPKTFRIPEIDSKLRFHRTIIESRVLATLSSAGLPVPAVFDVLPNHASFIMEFVPGMPLKFQVAHLSAQELPQISQKIGIILAKMHKLAISHGDLTTSNILLAENGDLVFLDFGLSQSDVGVEEKAMDIHLFKRVLQSTHGSGFTIMFSAFLRGYQGEIGKEYHEILRRVEDIEVRGRYIAKEARN